MSLYVDDKSGGSESASSSEGSSSSSLSSESDGGVRVMPAGEAVTPPAHQLSRPATGTSQKRQRQLDAAQKRKAAQKTVLAQTTEVVPGSIVGTQLAPQQSALAKAQSSSSSSYTSSSSTGSSRSSSSHSSRSSSSSGSGDAKAEPPKGTPAASVEAVKEEPERLAAAPKAVPQSESKPKPKPEPESEPAPAKSPQTEDKKPRTEPAISVEPKSPGPRTPKLSAAAEKKKAAAARRQAAQAAAAAAKAEAEGNQHVENKPEQGVEREDEKPKMSEPKAEKKPEPKIEPATASTQVQKKTEVAVVKSPEPAPVERSPTIPTVELKLPEGHLPRAFVKLATPHDIIQFIHRTAPGGPAFVQCQVLRIAKGLERRYPSYIVTLEGTNQFLLSARRRKQSASSNYIISTDQADTYRRSKSFVGKVRANWIGTEFVVYDNGERPGGMAESLYRRELCGVVYEKNLLGIKGPRKMSVLLPKGTPSAPRTKEESMIKKHKTGEEQDVIVLQNKTPKWSDEIGAYVLNFSKRVKKSSVKNFQLCDPNHPDDVVLQFGRVSGNTFSMDFRAPFSLMQALGVVLSSFDNKLACE